jgi:hypothetical protein
MLAISPAFLEGVLALFLLLVILAGVSGCQTRPVKPIVQTVVVEKPVQVPCKIPAIERPAWETERANAADPVTVSRAIRAELEQRRGYEALVEAAAKSCE